MKSLAYHLFIAALLVFGFGALEHAPGRGTVKASAPTAAAKAETQAARVAASQAAFARSASSPDACVNCHEDEVASFKRTTHSKSWQSGTGCEQCHGDVSKHIETGGAKGTIISAASLTPAKLSETCMNCHDRAGEQSHSSLSEHQRAGVACTTCHEVHPSQDHKSNMNALGKSVMLKGTQSELCLSCHKSVEADFSKPTHHRVKEGVINCSSCHNPHGSTQEHQLRADSKTLCISCHQDKRGPFIYEHNAMSVDGCMACHDNHGSSSRNMIKTRDPRQLCMSCHTREMNGSTAALGTGTPHSRGNLSLQTTGDCTRCHSEIHGSNRNQYFIQ